MNKSEQVQIEINNNIIYMSLQFIQQFTEYRNINHEYDLLLSNYTRLIKNSINEIIKLRHRIANKLLEELIQYLFHPKKVQKFLLNNVNKHVEHMYN